MGSALDRLPNRKKKAADSVCTDRHDYVDENICQIAGKLGAGNAHVAECKNPEDVRKAVNDYSDKYAEKMQAFDRALYV